jgi:poly(glycerol-phosphate) alpha-glucosyltransferase
VYPTQAAARLAIAQGRPLFYSQRGVFDPARLRFRAWKKSLYIRLVERPLMRQAAGLIALTEEEIASFRAFGLKTPIHLVPNGIDVTRFRRQPQPAALARLEIAEDQQLILFLGRIHETKGPDVLVDAFVRIAQQHPKAVLVIAGHDEQGLLAALRTKIDAADLGHRLRCPGLVTGELKLDLLARADLFVLPSVGEGLSMAILEALASGTPVVISRECNLPVVERAAAGAVVNRNAVDVAQGISKFLSNPDLLRDTGQRAFELARDEFGWPPILDRLESIYAGALTRP